MSGLLVLDQRLVDEVMASRADDPRAEFDECWEGRIVVPPCPNNEHYLMQMRLAEACSALVDWDAGERALPGGNVTDRDAGWVQNYRNPDLIVVLAGGRAIDRGPYWLGGPDLVAEVISPGEEPQAKFDFYAAVGCREVLILDRDPWAVELYRLTDGVLKLVGRSALPDSTPVTSGVLPLAFQIVPGADRPRLQVTHPASGRVIRA